MDNEKLKLISFAGVRHPDLPYYLARTLSGEGKQVLLIDNSELHDLFDSIHMSEDDKYTGETVIGNIHYLKDILFSKKAFEKFDYVIVYHGFHINDVLWDESSERFLMADTDRFHLRQIQREMDEAKNKDLVLLILDAYFEKIHEEDLAELLTLDPEKLRGILELPFDPSDLAALQSFQFNGKQSVRKTSSSMKDLLREIYGDLFGEIRKKDFTKILDRAD